MQLGAKHLKSLKRYLKEKKKKSYFNPKCYLQDVLYTTAAKTECPGVLQYVDANKNKAKSFVTLSNQHMQ